MKKSRIEKLLLFIIIIAVAISMVSKVTVYAEYEEPTEIEQTMLGAGADDKIHFFKHTGDGSGDCILVETNGMFGLVDSTTPEGALDIKTYLTKVLKEKKLDFIIMTHAHSDHVGGFPNLADFVDEHTVVFYKEYQYIISEEDISKWNNIGYMNKALKTMQNKSAILCKTSDRDYAAVKSGNTNIKNIKFVGGTVSDTNVDDNIYFEIGDYKIRMYNLEHISDDEENTNSIVTLITKGTQKIVLLADQETRIRPNTGNSTLGVENQLANIIGDVSLIKAGHHGNQSSNSIQLLKKMKPEYMIVTCGWDSSANTVRQALRYAVRYLNGQGGKVYIAGRAEGCIVATIGDTSISFYDYDFNGYQKRKSIDVTVQDNVPAGWQGINGVSMDDRIWTYMYKDGSLAIDWKQIGGKWYYFCTINNQFDGYEKNQMAKGWKKINYNSKDYWFYFVEDENKYDVYDSDGNITTNYSEGEMLTGRKQVVYNGKSAYYYFCEKTGTPEGYVKGAMVKDMQIGNYYYDKSGACADTTKPSIKKIKYSSETPTNKGVLVRIEVNEEVKKPTGWTLSANKRVLTKIYDENATETITITDLAGNSITRTITIKNIDKTPPQGTVSKTPEGPTNGSVTVKIKATEPIKAVSGWTLSSDQKTLTKTYSKPTGTVTVTLKDLVGNTSTASFSVTNIDTTAPTVKSVTYTPNTITNKSVVVKIVMNEAVKAISGWTLSSDQKTLTKTYTANTNGNVNLTITDLAGNTINRTINVSNIDTTAPKVVSQTKTPEGPTNGSVVVRFVFSEAMQYTTNMQNSEWKKIDAKTYEKTYKSNTDGTVTRTVYDLANNPLEISVKIDNIDTKEPTVKSIVKTPEGQTTGPVKVTITMDEPVNGISGWTLSSDKKTLTKSFSDNTNGNIKLTITDLAGNSITKTISVDNIVKEGPSIKSVVNNPEELTNGNVIVTITANEEVQPVSGWNLSTNKKVLTKEFTSNTNGEQTITVKNLQGIGRDVTYNVNNIDKIAPTVTSRTITPEGPTKGNVVVKYVFSEAIQYGDDLQADGWTKINNKTIEKTYENNTNGTLTRKVKDLAGNELELSININNIDRTDPTIESITKTPEGPTNGSVTVKIKASEEINEVSGWTLSNDKKTLTKVFTENTEEDVEITITDLADNTYTTSFSVDNIDTDTPKIESISYSEESLTNKDVVVTVVANEDIEIPTEMENLDWVQVDSRVIEKTYTQNTEEGGENLIIKDIAGNEIEVAIEVYNIDRITPTLIKDVEYSPEGPTNEDVTVTISISEPVRSVAGWGLSDDGTIITRTYSDNTEDDVRIYFTDLAGNTNSVLININNIDRNEAEVEEIIYSEENPTNKDVIVTVKFNEDIQLISEGWLKTDNRTVKKIYSVNTSEEGDILAVRDAARNETEVVIEVNNIDKVAPNAQISISPEGETTNPVTVTITADESIKDIAGWKRVDDKTLRKTYIENTNGNVTITISDLAGNTVQKTYKVDNIIKGEPLISSDIYAIGNMQIRNVSPNTKVETFLSNITIKNVDNIKVYDNNNRELSTNGIVTTGSILVLNDEIEYVVAVKGDLSGDGLVTVRDLALEQRKILRPETELTDIQVAAGDIDGNSVFTIKDLAMIQRFILTNQGL